MLQGVFGNVVLGGEWFNDNRGVFSGAGISWQLDFVLINSGCELLFKLLDLTDFSREEMTFQ